MFCWRQIIFNTYLKNLWACEFYFRCLDYLIYILSNNHYSCPDIWLRRLKTIIVSYYFLIYWELNRINRIFPLRFYASGTGFPLWFMEVWRWPAKPLVLFISGWLQSALGKEVFLWQKKQKVFIHSICSNVDPRGAF